MKKFFHPTHLLSSFGLTLSFLLTAQVAPAFTIPKVTLEYSYALDLFCPENVEPEVLTAWQKNLIPQLPKFREELLSKLGWFQSQWDLQGNPLMTAATEVTGKSFQMGDLQAAVFLCPRYPFMGTPLALNIISYLESSAKQMPPLSGQPLPVFLFVSTTFHEILHKHINAILAKKPSKILSKIPHETELYKAHLHLFALQRKSFELLKLGHLLPSIQQLEATHGADYVRAWKSVYSSESLYENLLKELK
ncbi:MAG: hypothetical protein ACAH59_07895 [Pseudobdellovibrionaceae bacterium]